MAQRQVVVSYPVDEEMARATTDVIGADADVVFLRRMPGGERAAAVRDAEVLLAWMLAREVPAAFLEQARNLEFVQFLSAGVDGVDLGAIPSGPVLAGNAGAYSAPIAEHVMAMTLAAARRLRQGQAALARGEFPQDEPLITLDGAVCAIVGFGGIGKATARLMRAFGARIHAVNSSGRISEPVEFAGTLADLDRVLAAADVVVLSLPLTVATRGLIGERELRLMKPAGILVNVGRAAVVDERALYRHLSTHPEFSAGIDVWWHEPRAGSAFRMDYPFPGLPNVIGSPHNSGSVPGMTTVAATRAAENVRRYLRGEAVTGVVRREDYAWPGRDSLAGG